MAQNFEQVRLGRRYARLAASLLEREIALTDARIAMFETLIGKSFSQAESLRDQKMLETALIGSSGFDFFVSFGYAIAARGKPGFPPMKQFRPSPAGKNSSRLRRQKQLNERAAADLIAYLWEGKLAIDENGFRAIPLTL